LAAERGSMGVEGPPISAGSGAEPSSMVNGIPRCLRSRVPWSTKHYRPTNQFPLRSTPTVIGGPSTAPMIPRSAANDVFCKSLKSKPADEDEDEEGEFLPPGASSTHSK